MRGTERRDDAYRVACLKIYYARSDGVDLTGDLYLPKGYDAKKDGPLPVLIWAYPREFNSASDAAQVRGSKDRFTMISWGSPVFWVTQGYAVPPGDAPATISGWPCPLSGSGIIGPPFRRGRGRESVLSRPRRRYLSSRLVTSVWYSTDITPTPKFSRSE